MTKLKLVIAAHAVTLTVSDAGANLLGFNIYRSDVSGGPYTKLNQSPVPSPYVDTTVVAGQTYYYVATAVNAIGESAQSNQISATIPASAAFVIGTQPAAASLAFSAVDGQVSPVAPQTVAVIATPATALPVTVAADQPWITVAQDGPTTKTTLTVNVDPTGPVGVAKGNVIVTNTDDTATNSPYSIPVTLTVTAAVPPAPVIS